MPVLGEKQGDKLRMYLVVSPELPLQESADEVAVNRSPVSREMYVIDTPIEFFEMCFQFLYLG